MKKNVIVLFSALIISLSCSKSETTPDPTTAIVNKWWCTKAGSTSTVASQYFESSGRWEQGSKGGKFNDTGTWALSSNKQKIIISSVLDYNKKSKSGWEYDISSATSTSLTMNWSAFNVKMDLEVCK